MSLQFTSVSMSHFQQLDNYKQDIGHGDLGFRTLKRLETKRGSYLNVTYKKQKLFLIAGTKAQPIKTPLGVKTHYEADHDWQSLSVIIPEELQSQLEAFDDSMAAVLADNSEQIWGHTMTKDDVVLQGFYTPVMYQAAGLEPLLTGRINSDTQLVDKNNKYIPHIESDLSLMILKDSLLRVVFKIESMYFKTPNNAKVTVKVAKIQLLAPGDASNDVAQFMFD